MNKIYAGIGSRETPKEVLHAMSFIAKELAEKGYLLRSGAAQGADTAFEVGCVYANGEYEIFIPWKGFNHSSSELYEQTVGAQLIAEFIHPNWGACTRAAKQMHSRNVHQILGQDLNTPVDFVLCWTIGGKGNGGTGQALRLAKKLNIPIIDLGNPAFTNPMDTVKTLLEELKE